MQYAKEELMAQQLVLAFLGFYRGSIDGIWSGASISAMQAFECSDAFAPGVPTFGMPFAVNSRMPKGMRWVNRLVTHLRLSDEEAAKLLKERQPVERYVPPVQETPTVEDSAPVVEEPAPVVEVVETVVTETPAPAPTPAQPTEDNPTAGMNKQQRRDYYAAQQSKGPSSGGGNA